MKLLPKEITPNPLLSSTVELRFRDEFLPEFVDQILPQRLQQEFNMQQEKRQGEHNELGTTANIVFQNDQFLVAIIDKRSIIFENAKHYQFWDNYFPFIKSVINTFSRQEIQSPLERVGIRYISFFAKNDNSTMMLKKPFLMVESEIGQVTNSSFFGTYGFERDKYKFYIQVGSRVQLPGETNIKEGCVIDLDISISDNLPEFRNEALFDIIDSLHTEEKNLFIAVLNKDFLNTLNIKY